MDSSIEHWSQNSVTKANLFLITQSRLHLNLLFSVFRCSWFSLLDKRCRANPYHDLHFNVLHVVSYMYGSMLRSICQCLQVLFKRFGKSKLSRLREGIAQFPLHYTQAGMSTFHRCWPSDKVYRQELYTLVKKMRLLDESSLLCLRLQTLRIEHWVPRLMWTWFLSVAMIPEESGIGTIWSSSMLKSRKNISFLTCMERISVLFKLCSGLERWLNG